MTREELFAASFAGPVRPPDLSLEICAGDDVLSHVGLYWRTLRIGGQEVDVAGIGGVATQEQWRHQGFAGCLMRSAHAVARSRGLRLAALFCDQWAFGQLYSRLGYGFSDGTAERPPVDGWPPNLAILALTRRAVVPYSSTVEETGDRW